MPTTIALWAALRRDESGVTSIEYALIGMLIAMAILVPVGMTGQAVLSLYEMIASRMPSVP